MQDNGTNPMCMSAKELLHSDMSVKEMLKENLAKLNKELEIAQETQNLEKVASLTFLISEYEVMLEEDEVRYGS